MEERYDLLVIGGGINGLGIAADAASRGLSVLVVEKGDWGGGTTSASSRLIHGGLRYLQYGEVDLVRESLRERGVLARQRPHLVHPIQLLIPSFRNAPTPRFLVGAGLVMYDLLARDPLFPHPSLLPFDKTRQREPFMTTSGLTGGYIYPDAQVEFPERLCIELVQETIAAGWRARNHTRVTALRQNSASAVTGACLHDELTGETFTVDAALTINAAGPWLDAVNRTLNRETPPLIGGTWGTHLVLPARETGPHGPIYAAAARDGRPFFLLPWDNRLLVGTTDVKFTGVDPSDLAVQKWEVEYLLAEVNGLFPDAAYGEGDIEATTIGVRPLPATGDKNAGAITRRHSLVDHARKNGVSGLASIVGGKLTTYRSLAEEAVDWALRTLGKPPVPCSTAVIGNVAAPDALLADAQSNLARLGLPVGHAPRLVALYGPAFADVLARVERDPSLGEPLGPNTPHFAAQVVHAVRTEYARTIDDIARRRLMLFPPTDEALAGIRRVVKERGLPVT